MFAYAKPEQKKTSKSTAQRKSLENKPMSPNLTGIPDNMKSRFENLSGFSFDDVRVHYNSGKPAQLQALAYTQGNQVYVAPGQEKHLGHELGHVVQQKEGRVTPTTNLNGFAVNDNVSLEREADNYGTIQRKQVPGSNQDAIQGNHSQNNGDIIQRTPAAENTGLTDAEFVDEVISQNVIIPDSLLRVGADLYILEFRDYECQIHIHYDPLYPVGENGIYASIISLDEEQRTQLDEETALLLLTKFWGEQLNDITVAMNELENA
jgi:hypothetical protein